MNKTLFFSILTTLLFLFFLSLTAQNINYFEKGNRYYMDAKNDSALICLNKAIEEHPDNANYQKAIEMLLLRSKILVNLTFFERALNDALTAYDLSKKHDLGNSTASSLLSMGRVHFLMYNDSIAEEYVTQAKTLAEEKHYKKELATINTNLALIYSAGDRNDESIKLASESLQMAKEQKDTVQIIETLNVIASHYINLNRWTKQINPTYQREAKKHIDEAMKLLSDQNIPRLEIMLNGQLVRYYRVEKNYEKALEYINKVIETCEPTHYSILLQMYDYRVAIYAV